MKSPVIHIPLTFAILYMVGIHDVSVVPDHIFEKISPHIIGGFDAKIEDFPFVCYMEFRRTFLCTCSIMQKKKILTAAHCLDFIRTKDQVKYLTIVVGLESLANIDTEIDKGLARRYDVAKIYWHSNYTTTQGNSIYVNDIAVVKLKKRIKFNRSNKRVGRIARLAKDKDWTHSTECFIVGYGTTALSDENGQLELTEANVLQAANIPVVERSVCEEEYGVTLTQGQVCVFEKENGKAACSGDSGGPIACKFKGSWRLLGITSYGYSDCSFGTVYTFAPAYGYWLRKESSIRIHL